MTEELSFEECMKIIRELKQDGMEETLQMIRELKEISDEIGFLRAWLRILSREPQYVA